MSLCPEAALRARMDDGEFWAHVFGYGQYESEDLDEPEITNQLGPCPECGEHGPCAYDLLGRPLFHMNDRDDEEIA